MSQVRIDALSPKLKHVLVDGRFVGWLDRVRRTRRSVGGTEAWLEWNGRVLGVDVRGSMGTCRATIDRIVADRAADQGVN